MTQQPITLMLSESKVTQGKFLDEAEGREKRRKGNSFLDRSLDTAGNGNHLQLHYKADAFSPYKLHLLEWKAELERPEEKGRFVEENKETWKQDHQQTEQERGWEAGLGIPAFHTACQRPPASEA